MEKKIKDLTDKDLETICYYNYKKFCPNGVGCNCQKKGNCPLWEICKNFELGESHWKERKTAK